VAAAGGFVAAWGAPLDLVVPTPPSRDRALQPVFQLGEALAARLRLPWGLDVVHRVGDATELKNTYSYSERWKLLSGAFVVNRAEAAGKRILLFDDLYRSGATMNAVAAALYDDGGAADVFALAITRTRSKS
jgi:predicted amidophosphoribosyltransferase